MSGIVKNVQLGSPAALPSRTRLSLADGISFNEWKAIGEQLDKVLDGSLWWVADWAAYGERWFRRDYGPALEQIWSRRSLQNLASVARRVEPSRRREGLSFTHHALVAALPADEQESWLENAETQGWSSRELDAEIARVRRGGRAAQPALSVRATGNVVVLFEQRAQALGVEARELALEVLALASQLDDPVAALEAAGARRQLEA